MLRLVTICSVNDAGSTEVTSEDLVGSSDTTAWALDGATSWTADERATTQQLIQILNRGIKDGSDQGIDDPVDLLRGALHRASCLATMGHRPSASGLVATLRGGSLAYALLGDITLVVLNGHQLTVVGDWSAIDRERGYMDSEKGLEEALTRARSGMNSAGGYWILSTEPAAADHAETGSVNVLDGTLILIATDGFARVVDLFGVSSWPRLLRVVASQGDFSDAIMTLRTLEGSATSMETHQRAKVSDDAAAVLLRVSVR